MLSLATNMTGNYSVSLLRYVAVLTYFTKFKPLVSTGRAILLVYLVSLNFTVHEATDWFYSREVDGNVWYSIFDPPLNIVLTPSIVHQRFLHFHGQNGARLDRDKSIHGTKRRRSLLYEIFSLAVFCAPDVHLRVLESIWVDDMVSHTPWNNFVEWLVSEWRELTLYVRPCVCGCKIRRLIISIERSAFERERFIFVNPECWRPRWGALGCENCRFCFRH